MYATGLARAGERIQRRHSNAQERSQFVVVQELQTFLACLPASQARKVHTATPEDIVVFFEVHYLAAHGRTQVSDGSVMPAFSTVSNALSALTNHFALLGRTGEWSPPCTGNPCQATYVRQWRVSYERFLWGEDVAPIAAAPISTWMVRGVLRGLDATAVVLDITTLAARGGRDLLSPLIAQRDAAVVAYLHASWQRGGEGGRLRLCDLHPTPDTWFSEGDFRGDLQLPTTVVISPNGTKGCQRRRAGSLTVETMGEDPQLCCVRRIALLLKTYHSLGQSTAATSSVFRACTPGGHRLTEAPMSYGTVYQRLKGALTATHPGPAPETPHSFRRSGLLSSVANPAVGMAHALLRTPAVFDRYTRSDRVVRGDPPKRPRT